MKGQQLWVTKTFDLGGTIAFDLGGIIAFASIRGTHNGKNLDLTRI